MDQKHLVPHFQPNLGLGAPIARCLGGLEYEISDSMVPWWTSSTLDSPLSPKRRKQLEKEQ